MAKGRFRLKGVKHIRRLLARLPDEVRAEMVKALEEAAPVALAIARRGNFRDRTGKLRRLLKAKVRPRSLRLLVGLITAKDRRDGFYGGILEGGRAAKVVTVRRAGKTYQLPIKPLSRSTYDIVRGRQQPLIRKAVENAVSPVWDRALRRATAAAGSADA